MTWQSGGEFQLCNAAATQGRDPEAGQRHCSKAAAADEQQAVVSRLQEQMQGVQGKAGGLELQLADLRNQVKEERRQAEEAHHILVVEQEVGTHH